MREQQVLRVSKWNEFPLNFYGSDFKATNWQHFVVHFFYIVLLFFVYDPSLTTISQSALPDTVQLFNNLSLFYNLFPRALRFIINFIFRRINIPFRLLRNPESKPKQSCQITANRLWGLAANSNMTRLAGTGPGTTSEVL